MPYVDAAAKSIIAITENQIAVTAHVASRKQSINNRPTLEHSRPDSRASDIKLCKRILHPNRIPEVLIAQLDYLGCNPAARSGYHTVLKSWKFFLWISSHWHIPEKWKHIALSQIQEREPQEWEKCATFPLRRAALSGQDGFISAPFRKLFDTK